MQITFLEENVWTKQLKDLKLGIAFFKFFPSDIFELLALLDFKVLFNLPQPR